MSDVKRVDVQCPFCGDKDVIEVPMDQWNDWTSGTLLQNAMPQLDADTRERLITGICSPCWRTSL